MELKVRWSWVFETFQIDARGSGDHKTEKKKKKPHPPRPTFGKRVYVVYK